MYTTSQFAENIIELFQHALEVRVRERLLKELEPLKKKMADIVDEEAAKFTIEMFKTLTFERMGSELRIIIDHRQEEKVKK